MDAEPGAVTFVVRLFEEPGGRLPGIVERVRTGEKRRVREIKGVGGLIARMLRGGAPDAGRAHRERPDRPARDPMWRRPGPLTSPRTGPTDAARLACARLVRLPRSLEARLASHARLQPTREACALLFGEVDGPTVDVRRVVCLPNRSRSARRFAIEWADLENALRRSRHDLVGVFHTHPRGCTPSPSDREGMVTWPVLWFIGGPAAGGRLHVEAYHDDQTTTRNIPIETR